MNKEHTHGILAIIHWIKLFAAGLVSYTVLDGLWLNFFMRDFYLENLKPVARLHNGVLSPQLIPIFIAWVLTIIGLIVFVVPRITKKGYMTALATGFLYGIIIYGIYNLSNLGILSYWPLEMVVGDIIWGGLANGIVSCVLVFTER